VEEQDPLLAAVGARMRTLRIAAGFSLEELGHRSGVHPTHIGAVERGKRNPSLGMLGKVAAALELSVAGLVDLRETHSEQQMRAELAQRLDGADAARLRQLHRLLDVMP